MAQYHTEQKKMLLQFLREHSDDSFTVDEITAAMQESGGEHIPGKSTVYRLMTKLTEEKKVRRFASESGRSFVYQSLANEHCHYHLHLKCTACGKILHLDQKTSDALLGVVANAKDFAVSEEDTVLFGKCALCK